MTTAAHLPAAGRRHALGISRAALSRVAVVGARTIERYEHNPNSVRPQSRALIEGALSMLEERAEAS